MAALVDERRRQMLSLCMGASQSVKDLAKEAGISLPSAYRHVDRLVEAGLLAIDGIRTTPDGKYYGVYRATIRSCGILIDRDGSSVVRGLDAKTPARSFDVG